MEGIGILLLLLLFFASFLSVGVYNLYLAFSELYKLKKSVNWVNTNAKIIKCKLNEYRGSKGGNQYLVNIEYEYYVDNIYYVGQRIVFGYNKDTKENYHEKIFKKLVQCQNIIISYDPSNHQESTIVRYYSTSILVPLTFGVIFSGFPLFLLLPILFINFLGKIYFIYGFWTQVFITCLGFIVLFISFSKNSTRIVEKIISV